MWRFSGALLVILGKTTQSHWMDICTKESPRVVPNHLALIVKAQERSNLADVYLNALGLGKKFLKILASNGNPPNMLLGQLRFIGNLVLKKVGFSQNFKKLFLLFYLLQRLLSSLCKTLQTQKHVIGFLEKRTNIFKKTLSTFFKKVQIVALVNRLK